MSIVSKRTVCEFVYQDFIFRIMTGKDVLQTVLLIRHMVYVSKHGFEQPHVLGLELDENDSLASHFLVTVCSQKLHIKELPIGCFRLIPFTENRLLPVFFCISDAVRSHEFSLLINKKIKAVEISRMCVINQYVSMYRIPFNYYADAYLKGLSCVLSEMGVKKAFFLMDKRFSVLFHRMNVNWSPIGTDIFHKGRIRTPARIDPSFLMKG